MKILAVIDRRVTACESYRVIYPLQELEKRGHDCLILSADKLAQRMLQGFDDWAGRDIVLFNRYTVRDAADRKAWKREVLRMRRNGQVVIYDTDDDLSGQNKKVQEGSWPVLQVFSAVTVSTPVLKSFLSNMNRTVQVIPNGIPPEQFAGWKRYAPSEYLVIGLTGSRTHIDDWQPAALALRQLLPRYPNARVFISGMMPDALLGLSDWIYTPYSLLRGVKEVKVNPDGLTVTLPYYGSIMRQIDLLLCPVDPADRFSHYKSSLKADEGQLSARPVSGPFTGGSLVVATGGKLPIYKESVLDRETGFLVNEHTVDGWKRVLEGVLDCWTHIAPGIQMAGYHHAQRMALSVITDQREQFYLSLIEKEKNEKGISRHRFSVTDDPDGDADE